MIKYIKKCILICIVLRNFIEFLLIVWICGVVLSMGFIVWIMIVVVWKGGKFVFMGCLRWLGLVGFVGFSFIWCFCVIIIICCFYVVYKDMDVNLMIYE